MIAPDEAMVGRTPGVDTVLLPPGLSREYLLHHRVCPTAITPSGVLTVAVAPEAFTEALDELSMAYDRVVVAEQTSIGTIERLIERLTSLIHSVCGYVRNYVERTGLG